jgi:hypothetical protein
MRRRQRGCRYWCGFGEPKPDIPGKAEMISRGQASATLLLSGECRATNFNEDVVNAVESFGIQQTRIPLARSMVVINAVFSPLLRKISLFRANVIFFPIADQHSDIPPLSIVGFQGWLIGNQVEVL